MDWQLFSEDTFSYFRFTWKKNYALYSTVSSEERFLEKFKPVFLKQVHSERIINVDKDDQRIGDGLISRRGNYVIGIKIADCLPVYLFNDESICIIHCGWRGVIKGIARAAAKSLGTYNYVLGASIGPCCYEVEENVARLFRGRYRNAIIARKGKVYLGLKNAVIEDLGPDGLLGSLNYCTKCHPEYFYSYRRGDSKKRNYALLTSSPGAC